MSQPLPDLPAPVEAPAPIGSRERDDPVSLDEVRARHEGRSSARSRARRGPAEPPKLTVEARLAALLDPDSFVEVEAARIGVTTGERAAVPGDGVLTGHGTIHGNRVFVFAQDFAVLGGTFGQVHADKILRLMSLAERVGSPVIGLYDSGGARIQEGALALDACGALFRQISRLSGVVPQISVILGPCAGAAAYAPALSDVVFMVRGVSSLYLTGPDVVVAVTGERVTTQDLGGADVHGGRSGVATFVHDDERSCLEDVRYLVSLLPACAGCPPEHADTGDAVDRDVAALREVVPVRVHTPYDVLTVIEPVVDHETFMEFHRAWAPNIVCGLARLAGRVIGIVANQPIVRAGVLDADASLKAARFVRFCDAFAIPLVTFVDVPGFMPGLAEERGGILRHGAKLLFAYCDATVPRVQVILRKAYGGAYIVMDSPSVGSDMSFAWPGHEIAVMGAEAAVDLIHRRELAAAADPKRLRDTLLQGYRDQHLAAGTAARAGLVHEIIDPAATRMTLATALDMLAGKTGPAPMRGHDNQPI